MFQSLDKNKKIEIIKNIIILFFIVIICTSNIFGKSYIDLDEIWNFNFARNVSNGLIPYKDFNIIQTPLLAIICGGILRVFGVQLIVMRIIAVILLSAIFFLSYLILKKLTNKEIALLGLMGILVLFKDILCVDYNYSVLLIALILTYTEITQKEENFLKLRFRYDFLLGIVAGTAILFKQTTGLIVAIACIGYKIFKIRNKKDILEFIKIACIRFVGVLIPVLLFFTYLLINSAFDDFVDYAILATTTFSNKILYTELLEIDEVSILARILPIILVIMFLKLFSKNAKKEIYILFAYALSSSVVIYPISDKIHFCIGSLISFIAAIYILFDILYEEDNFKNFNDKIKLLLYGIFSFSLIFMVLLNIFNSISKFNKEYLMVSKEKELSHFKNIPENKGLKDRIKNIDNFIIDIKSQGKNVYILDAEAAIYMIPLDLYNKDYDMFLKGNIGKDGENGIIKRINSEENCIYLIKKGGLNWQNPNKVRKFIINNLKKVGEISIFDIYEK